MKFILRKRKICIASELPEAVKKTGLDTLKSFQCI